MSAAHVIVKQAGAGRVRLRGVFTDEQFARLPLVRTFGAFPTGYHATHFDTDHTSIASQVFALPESPLRAEAELARLERLARGARYVVEHGDDRAYFPSVAAAVAHVERAIVRPWVGAIGPRGGYSNRAPKEVRYGERPNEPGRVIASWWLRRGAVSVGGVAIRRLDARGALAWAAESDRHRAEEETR